MNRAGENNYGFLLPLFYTRYDEINIGKLLMDNQNKTVSLPYSLKLLSAKKSNVMAFFLIFVRSYTVKEVNFSLFLYAVMQIQK